MSRLRLLRKKKILHQPQEIVPRSLVSVLASLDKRSLSLFFARVLLIIGAKKAAS